VHVPSRNQSGQLPTDDGTTAGTGTLFVTAEDGSVSTADIEVRYALANFYDENYFGSQCFPVPHLLTNSDNQSGGYVFRYGDALFHQIVGQTFYGFTAARSAFERALSTWRCEVGVNFSVDRSIPGIVPNATDQINTVSFIQSNQTPTQGTLIQAITYQKPDPNLCSNAINHAPIVDIDIAINQFGNFYFGTGTPPAGQVDFETLCLHELGHAIGLQHTNAGTFPFKDVMFPSLPPGFNSVDRDLSNNDIEGGLRAVQIGQTGDNDCFPPPMLFLTDECDITNVVDAATPDLRFEVYPNPFTEHLAIKVNLTTPSSLSIWVQDHFGRVIYQEEWPSLAPGEHMLPLDTRSLNISSGLYVLHVIAESKSCVFNLVKK
jgi:hypothetical protein